MNQSNEPKAKQNVFWPTIDSIQRAREVAQQGFWAAVIVAVVTTLFALVSIVAGDIAELPISAGSFIDVGIFVAIAFGIRRMSRVAAVLGLVVYFGNQLYMWSIIGPQTAGIIVVVFMMLAFIHGVRGTFAYHSYRKQGIQETLAEDSSMPVDDVQS
ncbi:MAG: hypothetical protein EA367_02515 [Leptolyngbya sp. DLM2.Bin15]|nr:MAG: hypothetical protein EA367_02515 [Leptolyngbya sp. DLM2.Bin15]